MTEIEITAPYKPLPWQIKPWQDKNPIMLLTGSAGGGKSRLAGEKVHAYLQKYDRATGLMLRKAREYASKSIVPFMSRTVIGDTPGVRMKKMDTLFEYENGSTLYWGGMKDDSQREGLRSIGPDGAIDIVWVEEANQFTEVDFNELLARMRGKAAPWMQVILSTNPDMPTHWVNQRLIIGGEASVYYSGATDNTYNPPEYVGFLNKLTGVLYDRLVLGKWVQSEGAVYGEFDGSIHLIDAFEIPPEWRRMRSIDFGYTNPFVCQWWAMDEDDRLYLYREIYKTQRLVEDHARDILRLSEGEMIEKTVSDHDAEDRATLERYGVYTQAAKKDVSPGIQSVKQRLVKSGDDKPRLFLMRGALVEEDTKLRHSRKPVSTIEEFPGYVWPATKESKPIREQPVKENDHGMDAMRYMVSEIDDGTWYFT